MRVMIEYHVMKGGIVMDKKTRKLPGHTYAVVQLPDSIHHELKIQAAVAKKPIGDLIGIAVQYYLLATKKGVTS